MAPPQRIPGAALVEQIRASRYPFWYPGGAKGLAIDYFVYATDFLPLGASADTTNNINIQGDSAFCILSAVIVETDTTNLIFLAQQPVLAALSDTGSGRQLSNTLIHCSNWFGTAQEPKYWDVPKILSPNSTFAVRMQNQEATARNLHVAFHGFKIFGFAPA
jgi:hypothetical protein